MTTLQRIRASRAEPFWTCFSVEFNGMLEKLRRSEDPIEWTVQPCGWRNEECTRIPGLLEGNFKDLTNTIDYFRTLISAPGGSPTGYALGATVQTNVIKSLVKLAIGFESVVNAHKGEHKMRTGTQQAHKPHAQEEYEAKVHQRRRDPSTRALQRHTYPDDSLIRLTRNDHEFYVWSSKVYEFYDELTSGLELGLIPEEAISIIVTHIPIVRPYASNPLPNAVFSEAITLMNRHWEGLSMIGGDDHTNDQGGRADSGFRDRGRVTASPEPSTKEESACT
ncbi:hypothetical protein CEP53_011897 [Fusarium sp. AF-6]|nr:hypothetical protein CEP53_011897 [Fusarium sp. AF-6]